MNLLSFCFLATKYIFRWFQFNLSHNVLKMSFLISFVWEIFHIAYRDKLIPISFLSFIFRTGAVFVIFRCFRFSFIRRHRYTADSSWFWFPSRAIVRRRHFSNNLYYTFKTFHVFFQEFLSTYYCWYLAEIGNHNCTWINYAIRRKKLISPKLFILHSPLYALYFLTFQDMVDFRLKSHFNKRIDGFFL